MHIHALEQWQHSHDFSVDQQNAEKNTKIVLGLSAVTMVAEIVAGVSFGSLALLADGWHMATDVAAFGITIFAYGFARRQAENPQYTFGTGKVSVLAGFTSAIILSLIAVVMAFEAAARLFRPEVIQFDQAIYVTTLGLVINLISAFLLGDHHNHHHHNHNPHHDRGHDHDHDHAGHHDHDHDAQHRTHHKSHGVDQNLRAAYLHVLADALTSVLAIVALLGGKYLGWVWLDPVMGFVGSAVIARWSYGLILDTGFILLDGSTDKQTKLAIVNAIEADADNRVTDLHVWNVSPQHVSATVSLVTHYPQQPEYYKNLLQDISSLSHVLVEVNHCHGERCQELQTHNLSRKEVAQRAEQLYESRIHQEAEIEENADG